ncbi:MAG: hypothetical protein NT150_04715, partial [Bacteroidetes bacterium]|nr:hypothetical protein [Bacteroidota bacterium]
MNLGLIKKYYQVLLAAFIIVASFSFGEGFESEAEMIKKADKLFEQKQYAQALDYYSQLVSLHAQDPNYNFKYGTCLLYASPDKEQALTFLKFAVSKPGVDEMAYFYVARAYHLNYYFKEAIKAYKDFRIKAKAKTVQENDVSLYIKQCEEGKVLIQDIQSINVLSRKDISRAEFFRGYQLNEFDRKILVKPDEFKTKLDKKNKEYSLIVHNPALSEVYYSSYGEKGENGKDLFKMVHFADGTWSTPLSLGPLINTALDEDYPYLHPSGKILYFSSKGHNSIGGYDIFKCSLDTLTNLWGSPVNVGFAINSPDDDILYITDMDENVAFFASSRASSKDEITVYKIVPNKAHQDNTVIKGIVAIENSKLKNAQITVTDMETGAVVGVFKSNEKTGAYSMTLPSSKQYSFKVEASGYGQMEEIVSIPDKKESPVINQKIELSKTPQEKMLLANQKQTVLDDVAFNQYYKKSADLQVNSDKDVAFNTQVVKEKIEEEPLAKHDATEAVKKETKVETTNSSFVEEAYKDARELEREYQAIQADAEAADFVAKIKSDEAAVEKKELIDLSKKLAQTTNPEEKQKIQQEIDQKGKQLRKKTREAVITAHYAEAKKKEAKNKKEEYVAANQYAEVIKEATDSKNTDQAIAKLETQKQKLEQIQERNKTNNQTSLEEAYTETQVSRETEQKNADAIVKKAAADLAAVEEEKKTLQKQIDGTKNKQLQEEFKLQIEELNQEIAKKQAEKVIAEADLLAIKTDTDPIPDVKTIQSLTQEVNTVKKQDVGEKLKEVTQPKDTSSVAVVKSISKEEKQLAADQYNSEMTKAKAEMDLLVIIDSEKKELENSLVSAKKAEKKEIQKKIDELKVAEEKKKLDIKYHLEQAEGIEKKAQLSKEEITASNKLDEKQVAALETFSKTGAVVLVPKDKTQEVKSNPVDTSKSVVAKVDTAISVKSDVKNVPIDTSKTIVAKIDPAISVKSDVKSVPIDTSKTIVAKIDPATNTKSDAKITPTDTAHSVTTKIDTTAKIIANTTKTFELKSDFKPENASENDLSLAALSAFGIQSDTGFSYGPSNTVKANLNNARASENEALSMYVSAKAKQEAAAATDKKGDKKKLNSEAQKLEKQSEEKQLLASENYFYANRAEYDYNTDVIKRAVEAKKVQVPSSKLSDIGNDWVSSLVIRERVKKSNDFKEKVALINEAYKKELEVLKTQRAIISQIKDIKEIELQIAEVNLKKSVVDTAATKTKSENAVANNVPKTEIELKKEKINSLQEGFGVVKNSEYEYSKDVAVQAVNKEILALEDSAVARYNEALALEEKAESATKSQAKKLKKQAIKLKRLGRIKEKEALAKTGELHEKENEVNKEKIKKEFLKKKITISDKQKNDLKDAEDAFVEAKKIREKAKKAKSSVEQIDLYNEAYEKETQALEKQEAVLKGGTKEEKKAAEEKRLQEEKVALEKQKEIDLKKAEENKVVVRQNTLDSLAKSKVVELTAQIAKEKDPKKKKALQAQSKEYELAADKIQNEALQKELKEDQLVFENNKKITEQWKNEKMDPAQQKLISALQKEGDSLMQQSVAAKENSSGIVQNIVLNPSYGLSQIEINDMLEN